MVDANSFVTYAEAARMLGVSRQRAHVLAMQGKLVMIRRHARTYVALDSVRARLAGAGERAGARTTPGRKG